MSGRPPEAPARAQMRAHVLARCQRHFPGWAGLTLDDVRFEDPKGFSSLTMAVRPLPPVDPPGAFYRHLEGKENAILEGPAEKAVFLALGARGVAARCHAYEPGYRLEALYEGRTLTADDLKDPATLRAIAAQLARLHGAAPQGLPGRSFFERLHEQWGRLASAVLDQPDRFPPEERPLCDGLRELGHPRTLARVRRFLPPGPLGFCHNDTYHGNIMRLATGEVRLLDFEFSCLGHRAYDFSNLFAETVMRHGLPEAPHFRIAAPEYTADDVAVLIDAYVEALGLDSADARAEQRAQLLADTLAMIPLSDFVYALAAVPLALAPIQKLRFLPYAHQRFQRFLRACGE